MGHARTMSLPGFRIVLPRIHGRAAAPPGSDLRGNAAIASRRNAASQLKFGTPRAWQSENALGFNSLFRLFPKKIWIIMQCYIKICLHYYPACNLQRNTHIVSSKNAMERCGHVKPCGLEFTPAHSMECVIAEKSSRSHADYFDLPNSRRRESPIFSLLRRKCRKRCFAC